MVYSFIITGRRLQCMTKEFWAIEQCQSIRLTWTDDNKSQTVATSVATLCSAPLEMLGICSTCLRCLFGCVVYCTFLQCNCQFVYDLLSSMTLSSLNHYTKGSKQTLPLQRICLRKRDFSEGGQGPVFSFLQSANLPIPLNLGFYKGTLAFKTCSLPTNMV